MGKLGWSFYPPIKNDEGEFVPTEGEVGTYDDGIADVVRDPLYDSKFVRELYFRADKDYSARFTVPILWDSKQQTIVNNESSEIIRMFNHGFGEFAGDVKLDLYPENLREEIDELNAWVYDTVNNGVYKSGFATKPQAYEENVCALFESLDRLERILQDGREFLVGGQLTEADVRLYTTLIRFDPVYVGHFKVRHLLLACSLASLTRCAISAILARSATTTPS